mgnify:CR=1 FL=1
MVNIDLSIIEFLGILLTALAGISAIYLRNYNKLYDIAVAVLNCSPDGIIISTPRSGTVLCNSHVIDALGLENPRNARRQNFDVASNAMLTTLYADAQSEIGSPEPRTFDFVDRDGHYRQWERLVSSYPLNGRAMPAIMLVDRTEVEEARQRLEHSRLRDTLTGLVNRDTFHDRVVQALEGGARAKTGVAVLAIEIDQFDSIVDHHGWEVAKRILAEVATRIGITTRAMDTASRVGQSRFGVLLTSMPTHIVAERVANRFLDAIGDAYPTGKGEQRVELTASIGIAMAGDDGSTSLRLLDNATHACHRSLDAGGGRVLLYDRYLDDRAPVDQVLIAEIRHGLEAGEFFVEYQPIVKIAANEITGFEALLRWRHPERGVIPPMAFIAAAERSDLINALGVFVLNTACADAARWPEEIDLSVNASVIQLLSGHWDVRVAEALSAAGLDAARLYIEITETASIPSLAQLKTATARLEAIGVNIVLDDFGTGQSSLSQLRSLPFDGLKIDRQFVNDLDDARTVEIVQMLISYCRNLGVTIVAEGVETEAQLTMLARMGCTHVQGYLLGRPMPQAAVERLMRADALQE